MVTTRPCAGTASRQASRAAMNDPRHRSRIDLSSQLKRGVVGVMGWQAQISVVAWVGFLAFVSCLPARAQTADIALDEREFHERFDEHGRVSGDIVMGVMIGRKTDGERDDAPLADLAPRRTADVAVLRLPTPAQDEEQAEKRLFCVRINSKDGRFEAENT